MNKKKYEKRYRCPYCNKMIERSKMGNHILDNHEEMIPEGFTHTRLGFNIVNKKESGTCVECNKESLWNENIKRYNRFCSDKCKINAGKKAKENMIKVYGKQHLLDDPEVQIKMLKNRKISGTYIFNDGSKLDYVGSLEKSFLEYLDKECKISSNDIITDYPIIEYDDDGVKRKYIPDFYIEPFNLIIEVKDGGNNKNNNPSISDSRRKTKNKEKRIKELNKYNYLRLTDKNFHQFLECINIIKNIGEKDDKVYIINENVDIKYLLEYSKSLTNIL